jgi:hypothetical protein
MLIMGLHKCGRKEAVYTLLYARYSLPLGRWVHYRAKTKTAMDV